MEGRFFKEVKEGQVYYGYGKVVAIKGLIYKTDTLARDREYIGEKELYEPSDPVMLFKNQADVLKYLAAENPAAKSMKKTIFTAKYTGKEKINWKTGLKAPEVRFFETEKRNAKMLKGYVLTLKQPADIQRSKEFEFSEKVQEACFLFY